MIFVASRLRPALSAGSQVHWNYSFPLFPLIYYQSDGKKKVFRGNLLEHRIWSGAASVHERAITCANHLLQARQLSQVPFSPLSPANRLHHLIDNRNSSKLLAHSFIHSILFRWLIVTKTFLGFLIYEFDETGEVWQTSVQHVKRI